MLITIKILCESRSHLLTLRAEILKTKGALYASEFDKDLIRTDTLIELAIKGETQSLVDIEKALTELVTLKDGKGKTISDDEYYQRKEPAWEAARQVLLAKKEQ